MTERIDQSADTLSMLELFRIEVGNQERVLTAGLLALERDPANAAELEHCMRAAHSLKGAARILGFDAGVGVAHGMEDCFVAAQAGRTVLNRTLIDLLLRGVDWLTRIAHTPESELAQWTGAGPAELTSYVAALQQAMEGGPGGAEDLLPRAQAGASEEPAGDRVLRVSADNLNRLLGLAGESLVEARWLKPLSDALLRLKRMQNEARKASSLEEAQRRIDACHGFLSQRLDELELFARRANDRSQRLYDEALASRMRPFADRAAAFPRMVRDLGRELGKPARLEIAGHATQVDRDILEKLDAPLTHLLRNAVVHGIEPAAERRQAGKPEEAVVRLEARHSAGRLEISVADDGRGIALERLRSRVVERKLTNAETAARLSEAELLEFLFLPGFTLKDSVDALSGRGVGLDIVQHMIKQVRGSVRVHTLPGQGTRFQLQLPLTLSVVRALLVEIGGEPYAFPLAHVERTLKLEAQRIGQLEGRQHFALDGRQVGLVSASQVLGLPRPQPAGELAVVVIGGAAQPYGLSVDCLLGERELVVQPLDERLGKVKDVAAGALMEDGSPVLILDVEDLLRSVDKLAAEGALDRAQDVRVAEAEKRRKRVLVVDDSLTVRELERKLLGNRGYAVEVAVDGMDGWNALRMGQFDLVVTDIDMPRLDGIELVGLIRRDPQLKTLPIMIVSYKDREDDRRRGLEAGADYYLTKGSFHDERLLDAVKDLIGEAAA